MSVTEVETHMTREELFGIRIDSIEEDITAEIDRRINELAVPDNGLGRFEGTIRQIGGAQHTSEPRINNKAVVIMCADNGITEEGVSQNLSYTTNNMAKNIISGKAPSALMADAAGIEIIPVDIGINADTEDSGLYDYKVAKGTKNFLKEPAMTEEQALKAIETGIKIVKSLKINDTEIICAGEIGAGNTTTSVSVICAILAGDPYAITGRGAGLTDEAFNNKISVIADALHKYGYDRDEMIFESIANIDYCGGHEREKSRAFEMVCNVGGLDIAGLIGVFIGGALCHIPIVIDGVCSAAAAVAAESIVPGCRHYMIASHAGKEPALEIVFGDLGLEPIIDASLCLGEGCGAMMLMPMLDMAMKVFDNMSKE